MWLLLCHIWSSTTWSEKAAVHCFISLVIPKIRTRKPRRINRIKYFSDAAALQYKNFKFYEYTINMILIFIAKHHFFFLCNFTWKSPCNWIGGTIKRVLANASLRAAITNQILTPEQLFFSAKENINGVAMYCY